MTPVEQGKALLVAAVAAHGVVKVARMLEKKRGDGAPVRKVKTLADGRKVETDEAVTYSHVAVSMIVRGCYPGKIDRVAMRALEVFGSIQCKHTGESITPDVCMSRATRHAPVGNPLNLMHWRTCQTCPHRPVKGEQQ